MEFKNIKMPEGYGLRAFDVLESSNDTARQVAADIIDQHQWIVTKRQTSGRGSRGREWHSLDGNLFCSLLYKVDSESFEQISQLSLVTAVALRQVFADLLGDDITEMIECKWPNDILIQGEKVSGILLETVTDKNNQISHIIIGIGVNIKVVPDNVIYKTMNCRICQLS